MPNLLVIVNWSLLYACIFAIHDTIDQNTRKLNMEPASRKWTHPNLFPPSVCVHSISHYIVGRTQTFHLLCYRNVRAATVFVFGFLGEPDCWFKLRLAKGNPNANIIISWRNMWINRVELSGGNFWTEISWVRLVFPQLAELKLARLSINCTHVS